MIKFFDMKLANKKVNINKIISNVISSYEFSLGKYVEDFEKNFAKYLGVKYCVGVGNCFDAIKLSFVAYKILGEIKNDDEVLVPANTYIASILAVTAANLKPVFVESDMNTFNISPSNILKAISRFIIL